MRESRRQTVLDVGLLVAVAALLAAIHFFIPVSIQNQFAFNTSRFAPWTLLTAAYVHQSDPHLLNNLFGYGLGAGVAYVLCRQQGRRRWFWMTTAAFLLVLPVIVELTNYVAFQLLDAELTSRGFSGVVAGYGGFVLIALTRHIINRYGLETGYYTGATVLIILLGEVTIIYAGIPSIEISVLLFGGLSICIGQLLARGLRSERTEEERLDVAIEAGFIISVLALLVVFTGLLFPQNISSDESTTNIIAHGIGFLLGGILPCLLIPVTVTEPKVDVL